MPFARIAISKTTAATTATVVVRIQGSGLAVVATRTFTYDTTVTKLSDFRADLVAWLTTIRGPLAWSFWPDGDSAQFLEFFDVLVLPTS